MLRQRKLSLAHLARDLGIRAGSVTAVSQGYRRSRRVERAIAEALDTTAEELFPDRNYKRRTPMI
ncbi:MAG: helix-turn-helix domain-containing protein [Paracoccaceae bacterium]